MNEESFRSKLVEIGGKLLGIPYEFGAEWLNQDENGPFPEKIDCSELMEGIYKAAVKAMKFEIKNLPDGASAQFNFMRPVEIPKPGDLAFFARKQDPEQIYHSGMLFDDKTILEARAFDGREWTGKVLLRERIYWERYQFFMGYRRHSELEA